MSQYIPKSHNVTVHMYHIVCPAKYRKAVFTAEVENELRAVCQDISERLRLAVLDSGVDDDHVHFLVQSVPTYSPTKIVRTSKRLTARELFKRLPSVKEVLWGGELSKGYVVTTVGRHGSEDVIRSYVKSQSRGEYRQLHQQQLSLFDD